MHPAKIGCLIAIAIPVLGMAGCVLLLRMQGIEEASARNRLYERATQIANTDRSHRATTQLRNLFGDDVDGVCFVFEDISGSVAAPTHLASAILEVDKSVADYRSSDWDSDMLNWYVYAVRGGKILRRYVLYFRSSFDITSADDTSPRCYDRSEIIGLDASSRDGRLFIEIGVAPERRWKVRD